MQGFDLIVDDTGEVYYVGSSEFTTRYLPTLSRANLISYLVRNCRHVRVRSISGNGVAISFKPRDISTVTVIAVIEILLRLDTNDFVVELLEQRIALLRTRDVEDAVAAILYYTDTEFRRPTYTAQPMPVDHLKTDERLVPILKVYRRWRRAHGNLDVASGAGLRFDGPQRSYLARFLPDHPIFEQIGTGYTVVKSLVTRAHGLPVHDQPDATYGAWVAGSLERVQGKQTPALEMVEAEVAALDMGSKRARYLRLLLPWRSRGEIVVSSTAVPSLIF